MALTRSRHAIGEQGSVEPSEKALNGFPQRPIHIQIMVALQKDLLELELLRNGDAGIRLIEVQGMLVSSNNLFPLSYRQWIDR